MEQIKPMDFCSGQGANHSNSTAIARICNVVMDEKTRFYVPDSVKHHTRPCSSSSTPPVPPCGSRSRSGMRVPVSPLTTRRRHTALLLPYTLGHRVVSCGDYATFIADGGYQLPALWLSDGWALATAQGWRAPLYWLTADDPRLAGQPPALGAA